MQIDEKSIIDIIVKEKYISKEDIEEASKKAEKNDSSILKYLIDNNYISMDLVGQALAEYFGVPYADLNTNEPTAKQAIFFSSVSMSLD